MACLKTQVRPEMSPKANFSAPLLMFKTSLQIFFKAWGTASSKPLGGTREIPKVPGPCLAEDAAQLLGFSGPPW